MLNGREEMTFQAQEFTGADLYIIIRSMMPRGRNTKKTQSLNAVKARTLRIILYQLTNRYREHSSLDSECRRKGVTLLSWICLCTARRKESRKKKCNQTSSRSIRNFGDPKILQVVNTTTASICTSLTTSF